jgi:hypothetical protein
LGGISRCFQIPHTQVSNGFFVPTERKKRWIAHKLGHTATRKKRAEPHGHTIWRVCCDLWELISILVVTCENYHPTCSGVRMTGWSICMKFFARKSTNGCSWLPSWAQEWENRARERNGRPSMGFTASVASTSTCDAKHYTDIDMAIDSCTDLLVQTIVLSVSWRVRPWANCGQHQTKNLLSMWPTRLCAGCRCECLVAVRIQPMHRSLVCTTNAVGVQTNEENKIRYLVVTTKSQSTWHGRKVIEHISLSS